MSQDLFPLFQNSSVEPEQYYAASCFYCSTPINPLRDGRAWINGMRTCLSCAVGGEAGAAKRRKQRRLSGMVSL
jgi:hypothetical protein